MKSFFIRALQFINNERELILFKRIFRKYKSFTMVPMERYIDNLRIVSKISAIRGDIVECGVWRGGMSAGMAEILGSNKIYHLFDSFEGLPTPTERDGREAFDFQKEKNSPHYFDNCSVEQEVAERAMKLARVEFLIHKGWFQDTIPDKKFGKGIALLRLDGDWYDSTMLCLEHFFPQLNIGGILIIDDYFNWDGCTLAVHDFLAKKGMAYRIQTTSSGVCYLCKHF